MKYKTSWNLKLLYTGADDPQIEKDLKAIEKICAWFEKKYRDTDYTSTPQKLADAFRDYEKVNLVIKGNKPWWYFALKTSINSQDTASQAQATKFDQRVTRAMNTIEFFALQIGKIEINRQKKFLESKVLAPYHYSLQRIFETAQYNLTEREEQLSELLSQTSYSMWVDGQEKILNEKTVMHKGKNIPISEASSKLSDLPKQERRELHKKLNDVFKSTSNFAEAEINAIVNYKKTMDELRGFKKPYSATILGYQNEEKNIEALIGLITSYFTISRRFYKLHAQLLGEKKITLADRGVKIGVIKKKFDFPTSVSIVRNAFMRVDKKYALLLDEFLSKGQIDVFPKKGKSAGAYSWGAGDLPTFVLLNHTDEIRSVETLGHEMGHALHAELSKSQPPRYQGHSISTAEVASTFFEQLTMDEIENYLSEKEKIIMLHNKILGDVSTIFRQVACFNFENELHTRIRNEGQISKEAIAELLSRHLVSYLGDAVTITPDDGYFFVYWSHIRRFFYVYYYAYGQIISRALFARWKSDPSYAKKIEMFLSAGKSASPEEIFKRIGIDTSDTAFFEAGLKSIEADIENLEKITKKYRPS